MTEWKIGMTVRFGRVNGEKTLGEIVKVNPKRLKVKQIGTRGRQKLHRDGQVWAVPKSLCEVVSDSTAAPDETPAQGRIVFKRHGMLRTYSCTCGAEAEEPSDSGVVCLNLPEYDMNGCGASAPWPRYG